MSTRLWVAVGLIPVIFVAVIAGSSLILVSDVQDETTSVVLQVVIFIAGAAVTVVVGLFSADDAARARLRHQVRSAFRRSLALNQALVRFHERADDHRKALRESRSADNTVDFALVEAALSSLQTQIREQLDASNHALDDWRDLVPDEVDRVEQEAKKRYAESETRWRST